MIPHGDPFLILLGLLALFVMSFIGAAPIPIPLPVTMTVLWLAHFNAPIAVIIVATVGMLVGWLPMEALCRTRFQKWMQQPKAQAMVPESYQRFFMRNPGFWVFLFNALPFPWDPMRVLMLLNHYPRNRFLLWFGLGRLIRNTLLVMMSVLLAPYKLLFFAVMVGFLLLPFLANATGKAIERLLGQELPEPDSQPEILTPATSPSIAV